MNDPKYRVSMKNSLSVGSSVRVLLQPGAEINPVFLTEELAQRLLSEGAIELLSQPPAPVKVEKLPPVGVGEQAFAEGRQSPAAETSPGQSKAQAALLKIQQARAEKEAVEAAQAAKAKKAPAPAGMWTMNPETLMGKSVDDLRQLVRQRDASLDVQEFDEVELIALLSADFTSEPAQG
jgi:hypothetical protein